jgi:ribonuclease HI
MEAMVVAGGRAHHFADLGTGSSEEAEWLALVHAAELASALGLADIVLLGDAAAVIAQAMGKAKCRNFPDHRRRFEAAIAGVAAWRLRHIARTQNLAGIALARLRA